MSCPYNHIDCPCTKDWPRHGICCQLYNNQKADRSVEEFRDFISNLTDVLDESKQYRLAIRYKKVVQVKPAPITFYFENHK